MKTISVKTTINQLIRKLGSDIAVADRIGIHHRYVRYLKNGQKKASILLADAIRRELGK